ncbi:hypothetical protein FT663_05028 [Candidozyma haemuli var. vulneris]|nr:hypothetical protein FT662_05092 [[Candida] haemuloni var. vulneris]KAF3986095.1 hypothetical protein FT663_05028 [[Candida] haemuloni var. vulneris]
MSSENGAQHVHQKDPSKSSSEASASSDPSKIDWKLLDQQNAELDGDSDYDSDSDDHNHGCGCCTGREVGTIQ